MYLLNSDFQDTDGFYVWYPRDGIISQSRFLGGAGLSIGINTGTTLTVSNNLFYRTVPGVYGSAIIENWARYGGALLVHGNSFFRGSTAYVLQLMTGYQSNVGMDGTMNYWNTVDSGVVQSLIFDRIDDLAAETAIPFLPFLASPDPATPPLP